MKKNQDNSTTNTTSNPHINNGKYGTERSG